MTEKEQLPHLLRLLDDDSQVVQETVAKALAEFGDDLQGKLADMEDPPDHEQIKNINRLLEKEGYRNFVSPTIATKDHVSREPQFKVGQLVQHKSYGYRGVVVAFDVNFQGDDEWYWSNQTQPDRSQPWYYVLVHNSTQVTYAAQTSLIPDDSDKRVNHPLVPEYFHDFRGGKYIRNHKPWPRD